MAKKGLLLLVLLLALVSWASSHGNEEGPENGSVGSGCQCVEENVDMERLTHLPSGSMGNWVLEGPASLSSPEETLCHCGSERQDQSSPSHHWSLTSLQILRKSPLSFFFVASSSYRSLASLSTMISAPSPKASPRHHSHPRTPSPPDSLSPHHSPYHAPMPSLRKNHGRVKDALAPRSSKAKVLTSPAPVPAPQELKRRHNVSNHHHIQHRPPQVPAEEPTSPNNVVGLPSDCSSLVCKSPLIKAVFSSPCGCVRPVQVELELNVPLYALFPLISVLAAELAEGVVLTPSQVEIVGANAAEQNRDGSVVDANLLPLDQDFDNITAFLIYQRLWNHEVTLNTTLFGNYSVVYVHYPGLPPSPPNTVMSSGIEHPLGVDVTNHEGHRKKLRISVIAAITSSAVIILVMCIGAAWIVALKCTPHSNNVLASECQQNIAKTNEFQRSLVKTKRSGCRSSLSSDLYSSISLSFNSSMGAYGSTVRSFGYVEIKRATNHFRAENVIGEGGFGRVFSGVLDDGTKVAVKMLTRRDDQQGGREFVAEVEMLSRLHHRNLVKLIGICTEEHTRCLIYELVPNGSVESHLHGLDKHKSMLSWETRMKIALGSARGLAYLHEDSNPRVIHRDFKAANILLENDFHPKVSDFGLAKVAPDEASGHLSTRVMGTFGYVAPEYAMTGHLLVKSDVYSYGVVLLELLSGRKPVDMSRMSGQENLVTWARPLLTSEEGLKVLVDPSLHKTFPFDNLARVAAIALMCVEPEVSHRPFMGEVVQALKLVYNDCCCDMKNETESSDCSQGCEASSFANNGDIRDEHRWPSLHRRDVTQENSRENHEDYLEYEDHDTSFISLDYDSGASHGGHEGQGSFPASVSPRDLTRFRRYNFSGPLRPKQCKKPLVEGSVSEHTCLATHSNGRSEMMREGNSLDFSRL